MKLFEKIFKKNKAETVTTVEAVKTAESVKRGRVRVVLVDGSVYDIDQDALTVTVSDGNGRVFLEDNLEEGQQFCFFKGAPLEFMLRGSLKCVRTSSNILHTYRVASN